MTSALWPRATEILNENPHKQETFLRSFHCYLRDAQYGVWPGFYIKVSKALCTKCTT